MREVRLERMRPAQVPAARDACPVAYLPVGPLEWHGPRRPAPMGRSNIEPKNLCRECLEAVQRG